MVDEQLKFRCLEYAYKICEDKNEGAILKCASNLYYFITAKETDLIDNIDYFSDQLALHCEYLFDTLKDDLNLDYIYELLKVIYRYSRNDKLDGMIKLYDKLKNLNNEL